MEIPNFGLHFHLVSHFQLFVLKNFVEVFRFAAAMGGAAVSSATKGAAQRSASGASASTSGPSGSSSPRPRSSLPYYQGFLVSSLAPTFSVVFTNPLEVAKVRNAWRGGVGGSGSGRRVRSFFRAVG